MQQINPGLFDLLVQLVVTVFTLLVQFFGTLFPALLPWLPGGLWCAWWLWGANWRHVWPVLARGAWAPVVLLMFISTLVWSYVSPTACNCLGFVTIPNFWWQLGGVVTLTAIALFCGWLQGVLGWTPAEVSFDPPAHGHGHSHGHGHGHGHH